MKPFKYFFCSHSAWSVISSLRILRVAPVLIDQALVSGGNFLTVAISAHNLNLHEQGKLGYILAFYLAISVVNNTVIFQWASYKAPRIDDRSCYMQQLAVVQFALALLVALISFGGLWLMASVSDWHLVFTEVVGICSFFFLQQLSDFSRRVAYLFQTPRFAALMSLTVYLPRLALVAGLAPSNLAGTVAILGATSFLPALQTFFYTVHVPSWRKAIKGFLSNQSIQSRWLMASGPLIWVASAAPLFIAGSVLSLSAVGAFITVRSLTNVANLVMEILETDVSARAGRMSVSNKSNQLALFRSILLLGITIWSMGMGVCLMGGDKLLAWVFGAEFRSYASVLNIMWIATGVNFLFRLRCVEERSRGQGQSIALAYASSAAASVLFTYVLVSWLGVPGISWAILLSISCSLIVIKGQTLRLLKVS